MSHLDRIALLSIFLMILFGDAKHHGTLVQSATFIGGIIFGIFLLLQKEKPARQKPRACPLNTSMCKLCSIFSKGVAIALNAGVRIKR